MEIDVNANNIKYISIDYQTTNPMVALEFDNSLSYKYKDGGMILKDYHSLQREGVRKLV